MNEPNVNEPITKASIDTANRTELKRHSMTPCTTSNVMMGVLLVPTAMSLMDKLLAQGTY